MIGWLRRFLWKIWNYGACCYSCFRMVDAGGWHWIGGECGLEVECDECRHKRISWGDYFMISTPKSNKGAFFEACKRDKDV